MPSRRASASDRRTFRTTFRDTLSSRQIALIGLPCTKNARRIFAIVSTISIPISAPMFMEASVDPQRWGPDWMPITPKRGPFCMPKLRIVGVVGFEQRIRDLVEGVPELADIMEPLLAARRVLREKFAKLHRKVLLLARDNEVCQRLMTIPGVGPVVSLAFISTVDVPARFRNSKAVGPSLGLTPVLNQSGESHRVGRISLCGDEAMRALLYEAAQVMLTRVQKWSWLKAWAMNIAKRRGQKKAIVALARRLAVIMHRMWRDGTEFRWTREMAPTI